MNEPLDPHRVSPQSQSGLVLEWERLAALRRAQIIGGEDASFSKTLTPAIVDRLKKVLSATFGTPLIVDAGCGTGSLASIIQSEGNVKVVGFDPSERSIRLARNDYPSTSFKVSYLSDFSRLNVGTADVVVGNMLIMNLPNLRESCKDLVDLLKPNGFLILTLIHPYTWSKYWDYDDADWFEYDSEIFVRAGWRISVDLNPSRYMATHIHRPLHTYVNEFLGAGVAVRELAELGDTTRSRSGVPYRKFPRFLLLVMQRSSGAPPQ